MIEWNRSYSWRSCDLIFNSQSVWLALLGCGLTDDDGVYILVIIFKYSSALRAALVWAVFDVLPDPWHTATGNVDNWTKHWNCPEYVFSSMSTYVTSNCCSVAISCKNWTKLTDLSVKQVFCGIEGERKRENHVKLLSFGIWFDAIAVG